MPTVPPQLIDQATRHAVFLERYKAGEIKKFEKFLLEMAGKTRAKLQGKNLTEFTRARLNKLSKELTNTLAGIYADYGVVWRESIMDLATFEAEFEIKSLSNIVDYDFALPSKGQLRQAVFGNPLGVEGIDKGKLLQPFFDEWSSKTIQRVEGVISAGAFQGKTTPQIVSEILGTKGAKFRDGIYGKSYQDATMMTRTALAHSASSARRETWDQNSDIVRRRALIATLDQDTTNICRSLDKTEWPLTSGPMVPLHIGCRTTEVAVLDDRFSFLREGATRSSRGEDGVKRVDAKETYYSWLNKQPVAFQDEAIGPARAKLLRDGGLSSTEFAKLGLGKNFEPLTLAEMRDLNPVAFERAGL